MQKLNVRCSNCFREERTNGLVDHYSMLLFKKEVFADFSVTFYLLTFWRMAWPRLAILQNQNCFAFNHNRPISSFQIILPISFKGLFFVFATLATFFAYLKNLSAHFVYSDHQRSQFIITSCYFSMESIDHSANHLLPMLNRFLEQRFQFFIFTL